VPCGDGARIGKGRYVTRPGGVSCEPRCTGSETVTTGQKGGKGTGRRTEQPRWANTSQGVAERERRRRLLRERERGKTAVVLRCGRTWREERAKGVGERVGHGGPWCTNVGRRNPERGTGRRMGTKRHGNSLRCVDTKGGGICTRTRSSGSEGCVFSKRR
jgi:hypothetical protein